MARRWTPEEENLYRSELEQFYVLENKTIGEIGKILNISESTVFARMQRLGVESTPQLKSGFLNYQKEVKLPEQSELLAEFLGIMLGDGHISRFQTIVSLGTKEYAYVCYVQKIMTELFGIEAHIQYRKSGYYDVYTGSVKITTWLKEQGLVPNKVTAQVDVPVWIFDKIEYMKRFVRGFFDTDGSVYKLKFGIQISITNYSLPLLTALQSMLRTLGYSVSKVSAARIYITRRNEIARFFEEIKPMNSKHQLRFDKFNF